jgi:hypothetical protein
MIANIPNTEHVRVRFIVKESDTERVFLALEPRSQDEAPQTAPIVGRISLLLKVGTTDEDAARVAALLNEKVASVALTTFHRLDPTASKSS